MEDVQAFIDLVESSRPATDNQLEWIKEAGAKDAQLQKVVAVNQLEWIKEAGAKDAQLQKVVAVTSQGWPTHVQEVPLHVDICQ